MRRTMLASLAALALSAGMASAQTFLEPLPGHDFHGISNPRELTRMGPTLFFVADSQSFGLSLWKTDGTFEGTVAVKSFFDSPSVTELTAWNGALYFSAPNFQGGKRLWRSDGTSEGTFAVYDIPDMSDPRHLTPSGRYLLFTAEDSSLRRELWRTDGTPQETMVVKHIGGPGGANPRDLVDVNGVLLFVADDGFHGDELWRSDGTFAGTVQVADLNPGPAGSAMSNITVLGDLAFFAADDGVRGSELWFVDANNFFGTQPVPDVRPGPGSSSPDDLTVVGRTLYFTADDGIHGRELWRFVPFQLPELVADINPGPAGSNPASLRNVEGQLFFVADDGQNGAEPWTYDEEFVTTQMVQDIAWGSDSSSPLALTDVNGTLMFQADNGPFGEGAELWTFSGTVPFNPNGPPFQFDLRQGPGSSNASQFTVVGDRVYLAAQLGGSGTELWTLRNRPPTAAAGADLVVEPGAPFTLSAFESSDPDTHFPAGLLMYEWRDPDGAIFRHQPVVNTSIIAGTYEFTLIVRDPLGGRSEDTVRISTPGRTAPAVTITSPTAADSLHAGTPFDIQWTVADGEEVTSATVLLSTDGGLTYRPLPGCFVPLPATSCTWTPPTPIEKARLRVQACDVMGDCGHQTIPIEVRGPLTGPQRLDVTVTGVDGSAGGVIGHQNGDSCFADLGQTEVTCTFFYEPGTEVTFEPLFAPPTAFLGWSGRCSGTGNCTVTMNGPRQVTAAFRPPRTFDFTVTVDSVDNAYGEVYVYGSDGSFQYCPANQGSTQTCTFPYLEGTTLDVQQATAPDHTFVGWAGDCTGDGPCAVTMDQPRQVAATFRGPLGIVVTVGSLDSGYGDVFLSGSDGSFNMCSAVVGETHTCTFPYAPGTQVQLEAFWGTDDSSFLGWAGDCTGEAPCALVVDQQRQVAATFQGLPFVNLYLNVVSSQLGLGRIDVVVSDGSSHTCQGVLGGSVDCVFPIGRNTFVSLRPMPAPDSVFFWNGGCSDDNNGPVTTGVCEFTMTGPRGHQGIFRGPQTLTVNVNSIEGGAGRVQTNFEQAACENTPGTTAQCVFPIPFGRVVALTAQPKPGSIFQGWSGACSGTGACTVTMSTARTVNGAFKRVNAPPVAHAGGPYVGVRNQAITFDGSGSSDPDGNPLTYTWDFGDGTGGPGVAPSHAYSTLGTFTVTLTVSDGIVTSAPATTSVTINNAAPVASPGGPYTGLRNQPIQFNGSGSSDPDGDALTYAWDFGDGTQGSGVAPTHAYASLGSFTVTLTVSDGYAASAPAITTVTIGNTPPQANAGPDRTVERKTIVALDGRASTDPDGSIAGYKWRQVAGPAVLLVGSSHPVAVFLAPNVHDPVVLEFELKVTDNDGAVAADRVRTTVTR